MRKEPGIHFKDCLEYAAVRIAAALFRILPLPLAAGLGRCIGYMFYVFDRRHRHRVISQMKNVLGKEVSDQKILELTLGMYYHFGTMLAEFVRIPAVSPDEIDKIIDWRDCETVLQEAFGRGKGLILVTGHLGNWEMGGRLTKFKGYTEGAIARPLDNPLIDRYVRRVRESCGQEVWVKFGALRHIVRLLRDGKGFGILADQDAGKRGVFVPFCGIDASTIPTPADLAIRTGAPILVGALFRTQAALRFRLRILGPLYAIPDADPDQERLRLLREMNRLLEDLIREEPSQWMWLHRRWKTRPKSEQETPHGG